MNTVKRTDKIVYYKPVKEEEEAGGMDIQQFFSFIMVFAGTMLKSTEYLYPFFLKFRYFKGRGS